jgi:hypothetical protein
VGAAADGLVEDPLVRDGGSDPCGPPHAGVTHNDTKAPKAQTKPAARGRTERVGDTFGAARHPETSNRTQLLPMFILLEFVERLADVTPDEIEWILQYHWDSSSCSDLCTVTLPNG